MRAFSGFSTQRRNKHDASAAIGTMMNRATALTALSVSWLMLALPVAFHVSQLNIEPYMDEVFHIPQVCANQNQNHLIQVHTTTTTLPFLFSCHSFFVTYTLLHTTQHPGHEVLPRSLVTCRVGS